MKYLRLIALLFIISSCETEEKAAITILEEVERGAIIRTVSYNNGEVYLNDENSLFSVNIEEQDILEGGLLESLLVSISFIDRTPENGDSSVAKQEFEILLPTDFELGPNNLPVRALEYSFAQMLSATGLTIADASCKDQFRLDLELKLTDGRVFTTTNSAGTVVNNSGFFKSPFSYLINIVEPIEESEFTGVYFMEIIEEGPRGRTFSSIPGNVMVERGHSTNLRTISFLNTSSETIALEFSVICDIAEITRYQKTELPTCGAPDPTDAILMGPDSPPGLVDQIDDTVLELYILEGFEGYNTGCDFVDSPAKFRLSKQ